MFLNDKLSFTGTFGRNTLNFKRVGLQTIKRLNFIGSSSQQKTHHHMDLPALEPLNIDLSGINIFAGCCILLRQAPSIFQGTKGGIFCE